MRRAFVSHSTADDSFVAEMESFLRAAGFDEVFNDVHAIKPDEKFWPRIEQGITGCDACVVVITAAATNSEWVKREVALARRLGKRVIPVWREDCPLPPDFADRDVIDFRPRARKERRFDIGRIVKYAPAELIGRGAETSLLTDAWQKVLRLEKGRPHVLTFVALGGEGKTSLVAKWAAELAAQDWPGCDAAFAWSFYSQGTREQMAASSDLFLKEALTFFGDEAMAGSAAGAFEKGRRLAQLVGERRTLLILDGLEPLQYAPTTPTPGELKDQGVAALLKGLAAASHGLCVVTTRYSLPDLKAFWQTTAPEVKLLRLSRDAGVHLLKTLGVTGTAKEFETLVEDVKGHALTLTLLGGFLKRAFHGDIRQRDRVKFEKADEKMSGGHAFRTIAAYERWLLRDAGDEGRREVAVLRIMGLFDRPADAGCLAVLRRNSITKLTDSVASLADDDWEFCLSSLEAAKLLTVNRDAAGALVSLDAHPLLRDYFAKQLQTKQLVAWRVAHRRLYEHFWTTTDKPQPTLEELQPLYQAVAHGCQAGLEEQALYAVYVERILRGTGNGDFYSRRKLGALASDLGALGWFFEQRWNRVLPCFKETEQGWLLNETAMQLHGLGRLTEALEPMDISLGLGVKAKDWREASRRAANLSQVELTLGLVARALEHSEKSAAYADNSGVAFSRIVSRTQHGAVLCHAGYRDKALLLLGEAEHMQAVRSPKSPLLSSLGGFYFCDVTLAECEPAAWQRILGPQSAGLHSDAISAVSRRASLAIENSELDHDTPLLDIALAHLALSRAILFAAVFCNADCGPQEAAMEQAKAELNVAVDSFRCANQQHFIPLSLLTRAWLRCLTGARTGPESAQSDLDEAWEIAERGPMRLHMADIHLYRARLFFREKVYPWKSPQDDLAAAEKLINECGYHRRDEELADAKRAILGT